ncbi:hypothetical protein PUNSTDRAFT_55918 [Punctularia strigosozonata HHB-11173 SS5]|uniref:C2H2-type domain-containing protein n=1 Tax=Punctularia strigosozonata (strain HHB-11173) TaxID=741275 RepID=R7S1T7_PUNST|nr:uncharacterized protein PUNSTDRAFT_55918 [Punctularia strigosozonata HHB-11173 SS5]EIN03819.1 hypothetical protein PUNSTDRAFT_55918 [Punctularia strigosozonata HHB-11173 SS5]
MTAPPYRQYLWDDPFASPSPWVQFSSQAPSASLDSVRLTANVAHRVPQLATPTHIQAAPLPYRDTEGLIHSFTQNGVQTMCLAEVPTASAPPHAAYDYQAAGAQESGPNLIADTSVISRPDAIRPPSDPPSPITRRHSCKFLGCARAFSRYADAKRHYQQVHDKKRHCCGHCSKTFQRVYQLRKHGAPSASI